MAYNPPPLGAHSHLHRTLLVAVLLLLFTVDTNARSCNTSPSIRSDIQAALSDGANLELGLQLAKRRVRQLATDSGLSVKLLRRQIRRLQACLPPSSTQPLVRQATSTSQCKCFSTVVECVDCCDDLECDSAAAAGCILLGKIPRVGRFLRNCLGVVSVVCDRQERQCLRQCQICPSMSITPTPSASPSSSPSSTPTPSVTPSPQPSQSPAASQSPTPSPPPSKSPKPSPSIPCKIFCRGEDGEGCVKDIFPSSCVDPVTGKSTCKAVQCFQYFSNGKGFHGCTLLEGRRSCPPIQNV